MVKGTPMRVPGSAIPGRAPPGLHPSHVATPAYSNRPTQDCGGLIKFEVHLQSSTDETPVIIPHKSHSRDRMSGFAYSVEIPQRILLWHNRLGHLGATIYRRMLPTLAGHTVCPTDAEKVGACAACSQGKFAKQNSKWNCQWSCPACWSVYKVMYTDPFPLLPAHLCILSTC